MKSERNIFLAFILNFSFVIFEIFGGIFTGSVAIISDAVHDLGDAMSIGISFFLEKKSKKEPDEKYTYGYKRYSVLGGLISVSVLIISSVFVVWNAVLRIIDPIEIRYNAMILFAVIGFIVNFLAAMFTRHADSLNQKAINLHMLEDVLGWFAVLVCALVMRFTSFSLLDPIISIAVAAFILISAVKSLGQILDPLLEKAPRFIDSKEITEHVLEIDGVTDIHHLHIWSLDGCDGYATLHVVYSGCKNSVRDAVKKELSEHGISHSTVELEEEGYICEDRVCQIRNETARHAHLHHHHH